MACSSRCNIIEELCPLELSAIRKYSVPMLSNAVTTNHMWAVVCQVQMRLRILNFISFKLI